MAILVNHIALVDYLESQWVTRSEMMFAALLTPTLGNMSLSLFKSVISFGFGTVANQNG